MNKNKNQPFLESGKSWSNKGGSVAATVSGGNGTCGGRIEEARSLPLLLFSWRPELDEDMDKKRNPGGKGLPGGGLDFRSVNTYQSGFYEYTEFK